MTSLIKTSGFGQLWGLTFQARGAALFPRENGRLGWSPGGKRVGPDDWATTALTLSFFAKMGIAYASATEDLSGNVSRTLKDFLVRVGLSQLLVPKVSIRTPSLLLRKMSIVL